MKTLHDDFATEQWDEHDSVVDRLLNILRQTLVECEKRKLPLAHKRCPHIVGLRCHSVFGQSVWTLILDTALAQHSITEQMQESM